MQIDKDYSITNDAFSWTLKWSIPTGNINAKTGKEENSTGSRYYGTLQRALEEYLDRCCKPAESASEMIQAIENAKNEIIAALKKQ